MGAMIYSPGLDGVVAGQTRVSCVDQGQLLYRGYNIQELAEKTTFEEVVHLMLYGELPTDERLQFIMDTLDSYRTLPEPIYHVLQHPARCAHDGRAAYHGFVRRSLRPRRRKG